jgi:hypothetical protein
MTKALKLILALSMSGLGLYGCSVTPEAAAPEVLVRTADSDAPIGPTDPTPGGPSCDGTCQSTTDATKTTIRARVAREARLNGWSSPVITFGLTCCTVTYFSVDYLDSSGNPTYINGTYDAGNGSYTFYP